METAKKIKTCMFRCKYMSRNTEVYFVQSPKTKKWLHIPYQEGAYMYSRFPHIKSQKPRISMHYDINILIGCEFNIEELIDISKKRICLIDDDTKQIGLYLMRWQKLK